MAAPNDDEGGWVPTTPDAEPVSLFESEPLPERGPADFTEVKTTDDEGRQLILTEDGYLSVEDYNARAASGNEPALVAEEELAEADLEAVRSANFDAPVTTFLERGAGAATFGITDLLRGAESSYEAGQRVQYNPNAALAGELVGSVAPGLLSGGGGAVGAAARLTPAGRLSALTGRMAARGGLRSSATAGLLEGAAGAAGDYVSRTSLDEDAEFSADGLLGAMVTGGALGAGIGGGAELIGKGLGRLATRRARGQAVGEATSDVKGVTGILDPPKGKRTSFKAVVKREIADNNADAARRLEARIQETATQRLGDEAGALLTDEAVRLARASDAAVEELATRARTLATQADEARTVARTRWATYADEVDLASAKRKITKSASDETEDALVSSLAEAEEITAKYADTVEELRARAGLPMVERSVDAAAGKAAQDLGVLGRAKGFLGGVKQRGQAVDKLTSAAGLTELAAAVQPEGGIPTAKDIPVVGDILSLYLRYKGARAAATGVGFLPATKATRAAATVNEARTGISESVRAFAQKRAPRIRGAAILAPAQVASRVAAIGSSSAGEARATAMREADGTTEAVQRATGEAAARAVGYLQATAPRDPVPARTATMAPWSPSQAETEQFSRRLATVADPAYAVARILDTAMSTVELDALRSVYPSMYRALQEDVQRDASEIRANKGDAVLARLGWQLRIPVTVETAYPGYARLTETQAPGQDEPSLSLPGPSTPGASPSVQVEEVRPRG